MCRWFAAVLGVALLFSWVSCSPNDGTAVPWLAVYYKPLNAIAVRPLNGECGMHISVSEDEGAIRLSVIDRHDDSIAYYCPLPYGMALMDLGAPVGNRTIESADPAISGVPLDIGYGTHFPITTKNDLPYGVDTDQTSDDRRLVLFYGPTAAHPSLKLTSTVAAHDYPPGPVEPCESSYCWAAGQCLFRIDPLRGDEHPLSRTAAVAAAEQLTSG